MPTNQPAWRQPSRLALAVIIGIFILLFGFGSTSASANLVVHPWDKLVHFGVFSTLTVALRLSLPKLPVSIIIGLALSIALADELHQFFVPQRQPDWDDGLADAVGVLCGLIAWGWYKKFEQR